MYPKKLIEKLTHGKSVSHLIKTMTGKSKPPEVVTCFGSFKANMDVPGDYWEKQFFTYSRNGGPIQRITIDHSNVESDEDHIEIDALCSKVDKDLIRGQDGESLAFYINAGTHGLTTLDEQAIPVVNGNIYHMPDSPQLMSMSGPDQFEYAITGINGEGKIVLPSAYVVDARDIAVPHPLESIDTSNVIDYPRWYPKNSIQTEDNIITIYPSEGVSEYDFDLFKVMGGAGDTPIVVHSCVVAVPPKVQCLPSFVYTADIDMPAMTRLNIEATPQSLNLLEGSPNTVNGLPFPFNMDGQSNSGYKPTNWPDSDGNTWGWDWVCTYSKNDGPIKTIGWNTGSNEGSHHSVWEAIKALMLDDEGRTAFTLTGFNAISPRWDRPSLKSGLSSGARFGDFNPDVDTHMWTKYEYREDAASVEIKDRQMQFTQTHAGLAWKENKLVIYPTTFEDAKQIGIYEYDDYYNFLCQFEEQVDEGNPITLHSCAVVEPIDHVRPNTGFKLDMSAIGEVMPPGLMARVQINDGEIKEFAEEGELMEKVLADLINYVSLLGADPIVTPYSGMDNNDWGPYARVQSKTNLLYFKSVAFNRESFIVGCSGIERPGDFNMELMNIDMEAQKMELLQVEILDDMDSDTPHVRGSNKVTFHRAVGSEYLDFFDFIAGAKGDTHTIYSSAGVPCLLIGDSVDEGGDDGSMDDLEHEYMQWRAPWVFKLTKTNGRYESFNPTVFAQYGTDFVITDYDTGERLASSFGRTHEGIIQRIPENNNLDIIFDMDKLNTSRTFELYFGITGGSVIFGNDNTTSGLKEGELEIIEWNSDCAPKVKISASNMTVKLPQTLPKEWTSLNSMFTYTNMANPDISMWDVSHVVDMDYMFENATGFNQDLSNWCVQRISSEPYNFRKNATKWTLPKPVWGTCPAPKPDLPDGTPFEFNVTTPSDYNSGSGQVMFKTQSIGYDYVVLVNDKVALTNTISEMGVVSGSNNQGGINIFLRDIPAGTTTNYKIYARTSRLTLGDNYVPTDDITLIDIVSFSNLITAYSLRTHGWPLRVPTSIPSTLTDLSGMFFEARAFNQDISMWDTSNVTNMSQMFFRCSDFNQPLNDWNVSNVTDMSEMFNEATAFNQPLDNWNVSELLTAPSIFKKATNFNQNLSSWNVSKLTKAPYEYAVDAIHWAEPHPKWNTDGSAGSGSLKFEVTHTRSSVSNTEILIILKDIVGGWELYRDGTLISSASVKTTEVRYYTEYANEIRLAILPIPNTTTSYEFIANGTSVTIVASRSGSIIYDLEYNIKQFTSSITNQCFVTTQDALTVPTVLPSYVQSLRGMFDGAYSFNQDISMWDVSNVVNMDYMFNNASKFNQDLSEWCVSLIPKKPNNFDLSTADWTLPKPVWGTCPRREDGSVPLEPNPSGLKADYSGTGWYKATDTGTVFCKGVPALEKAVFEEGGLEYVSVYTKEDAKAYGERAAVSNITDMDSFFANDATFNEDISTWDVSNVVSMSLMFVRATSFNSDISSWDVSSVTDMYGMFYEATSFNSDISSWNVSNVTEMGSMFYDATSFNQDLSSWCVPTFPTAPTYFDTGATAYTLPKPVWGTDGKPSA